MKTVLILLFNCGSSNADKNPLVKDQNLGFRPWSLAVKFKPGAKEGANPILSQTNGEARRGIYLQLEQNQLVLHLEIILILIFVQITLNTMQQLCSLAQQY